MTTLPKLSIVFALLALANTHVYAGKDNNDTTEEADSATAKVEAPDTDKGTSDATAESETEPDEADDTKSTDDKKTSEADNTETPDGDTSAIESDAEDPDTSTEKKATETKATETKPAPTVKKKKGKRHGRAHRTHVNKACSAAMSAVTNQTSLNQDVHCSPCQTAEAPVVQTIDVAEGPCEEACTIA